MKIKVNKLAIEMLFFKTTLLLEINVETVILALLFSYCSSMILNCKLGDFLGACNLSNVMGSTTGSERFLILLRATYVIPIMFSDFLKSTQAFLRVRPWLSELSFLKLFSVVTAVFQQSALKFETWVMGQIGTHLGNEELNYHTYWKTW